MQKEEQKVPQNSRLGTAEHFASSRICSMKALVSMVALVSQLLDPLVLGLLEAETHGDKRSKKGEQEGMQGLPFAVSISFHSMS